MNLTEIIAQHEVEITRLGIALYQPSFESDYLFLHWWLTLNETGDIKRLIIDGSRKLSSFYQVFTPPTITLYTCDKTGAIDYVCWLRPASAAPDEQAVFISAWASKKVRGRRKHYNLTRLIHIITLTIWPTILGTTWQPELLELYKKMGYDVVGLLPNTYGQEHIYLIHLTKEKFETSRFYQVGLNRRI